MKYSKYNLVVKQGEKTILFNTLQGHCVEIDEEIKNSIVDKNIEVLNTDTLNLFKRCNIVIDDKVDEKRIFTYFHDREKYTSNTVNSTVLLTWACNLKCVYCFEGEKQNACTMNKEQANQYICFIKNLVRNKKAKNLIINLFGGEPLANIEIGYYILDSLKAFCQKEKVIFSSTIITNGTLLTEKILDKLLSFNCKSIQITLDGIKSIHDSRRMEKNGGGTFDKIIGVLQMLNSRIGKQRLFNTVIRINIDKTNIAETKALLDYIGKDNINLTNCTVDFGIVHGFTESCAAYSSKCFLEEEIGEVLDGLWNYAGTQGFYFDVRPMRRWLYCGLYGDSQYTVTPECDVYKCWEHAGEEEHKIGALDENGELVDIKFAFYDWMSHNPLDNKECENCVYLPSCGGGCAMVSYAKSRTYHSPGCFKIKGVIEKQICEYVRKLNSYE